jgi:hypothetical protein
VSSALKGAATVLAACVAAGATGSCDREDLTVATFAATVTPDGGDDAAVAPDADIDTPCFSDKDCPSYAYCERSGCGNAGSCQSPTCDDEATRTVQCGCNGISYYNSCERENDGQSMRHAGPCEPDGFTPTCQSQADCKREIPTNGYIFCALEVIGDHDCDDDAMGTCWVLPQNCTEVNGESDPPEWKACNSGPGCESQCQAIANGVPYSFGEDSCQ